MLHKWLWNAARRLRRLVRQRLRPFLRPAGDPEKTYCVLAWKHLQINPEGTAKLCCRAAGSVRDEAGNALSLDTHSLADIWNSPYMRDVRRKMVDGEPIVECASCYESEAAGLGSYRVNSNNKWLPRDGLTVAEAIRRARASDDCADEHPVFFQLNLGNLCNLKCRMCSSSYSSQIEADEVHSEWAPRVAFNDSGMARWSGEVLALRPWRFRDVTGPGGATWSGGGAFAVPVGEADKLTGLEIKLSPAAAQRELLVTANCVVLYRGVPAVNGWPERFDLSAVAAERRLEVRVDDMRGDEVGIDEAALRRTVSSARRAGFNNVISTRFDTPGDWHEQDRVIFDEILKRSDTLQELYFTGGEPLISKKFHAILAHLVERGVAGRMTLQLNSNITKLTDEIVEKLTHFGHVTFTLSIDGAYDVYEYIRYPAKWPAVAANARRLMKLTNAEVFAIPVITAYNALSLTDLFRFCDELGIRFGLSNCYGPDWLMLHALPPNALELAGRRFLDYADRECRPENVHVVRPMGEMMLSGRIVFRPDLVPVFNAFTNELDASRGQNFAQACPELVRLMAESGHPWTPGGRVELLPLGLPTKAA
jgi:glutamate-1-semialdehyde 2,1-aminomutase